MTVFTDKEAAERLLNRHKEQIEDFLREGDVHNAEKFIDMRLVEYLERIIAEDE